MKKLLSAPNLPAEYTGENKDKLTHEELAHAYSIGMEYLQSQVPYIFSKSTYASNSHTWKVASGARCLSRPKLKRTERQWTLQTYLLLPITTEKERKNQIS